MIVTAVKKPKQVKAVLWDGTNVDEVIQFLGEYGKHLSSINVMRINTPSGWVRTEVNTWIVNSKPGDYYPHTSFEEDFDIQTESEE